MINILFIFYVDDIFEILEYSHACKLRPACQVRRKKKMLLVGILLLMILPFWFSLRFRISGVATGKKVFSFKLLYCNGKVNISLKEHLLFVLKHSLGTENEVTLTSVQCFEWTLFVKVELYLLFWFIMSDDCL